MKRSRKIIAILCVLVLLLGSFPISASAGSSTIEFTSHDDRETIEYATTKVRWKAVTNANCYEVIVKELYGQPNPSESESGDVIIKKSPSDGYSNTYISISESKLTPETWIKIYVRAYDSSGNGIQGALASIYLYVDQLVLESPEVTSHSNKDTVTLDAKTDKVTINWNSVDNAEGYWVVTKLLDGEPQKSQSETGTKISDEKITSRSVSVSKSDLEDGKWLKVWIRAYNESLNAKSGDTTIYLYISISKIKLATPKFTSHDDKETLYPADIDNTLTFKCEKVTNAANYWCIIKQLKSDPNPNENEEGTVLAEDKSLSNPSLSVSKDKLTTDKWLKIWMRANPASSAYEASSNYIYVYIASPTKLATPAFTSHSDKATLYYSDIGNSLTFSCGNVANAANYWCIIKQLNGDPNPSENEDGTVLAEDKSLSSPSLSVSKDKLTTDKWLKIWMRANPASSAYEASSNSIYVYIASPTKLATPTFTSHSNKATLYYSDIGSSLTFSCGSVANAANYWCIIKQLKGDPNPSENEDGTVLAEDKSLSSPSLSISKDQLTAGKWLKIWMRANPASSAYEASSNSIYVYIASPTKLATPTFTSPSLTEAHKFMVYTPSLLNGALVVSILKTSHCSRVVFFAFKSSPIA